MILGKTTNSRSHSQSTSTLNVLPVDIADVASLLSMKYDTMSMKKNTAGMTAGMTAAAAAAVTTTSLSSSSSAAAAIAVSSMSPDIEAQILADASYVVMDIGLFIPQMKISKLRMRYAQVLGRLMILGISFLPGHGFHTEEIAVQLFLLSANMQPILRSITLFQCIASSGCVEECSLELEDLQSSFYITTSPTTDSYNSNSNSQVER